MRYDKLIRDNAPAQMRAKGVSYVTRTLNDDAEYTAELAKKLVEEAGEFRSSLSIEELADILEVVRALADVLEVPLEFIERARATKAKIRGGFAGRIWLETAEDPE